MKKLGAYKSFKIYEVTEKDILATGGAVSSYTQGSILIFTPDEEIPTIGYEEWNAGTMQEAKDFIDSYELADDEDEYER